MIYSLALKGPFRSPARKARCEAFGRGNSLPSFLVAYASARLCMFSATKSFCSSKGSSMHTFQIFLFVISSNLIIKCPLIVLTLFAVSDASQRSFRWQCCLPLKQKVCHIMWNRQDTICDSEIGIFDPDQLCFTVMIRMCHNCLSTF